MDLRSVLAEGQVIPAFPLALDENRRWSERHQRALVRYYLDAGCGGLAVGVHSTQFEIREPRHGLFEPVLALAAEEIDRQIAARPREFVKVAGICGRTEQAVAEAQTAVRLGYHAGLLSLTAWKEGTEDEMIAHCREVAGMIPVIGFYLQTSVGGRTLPYSFWRQFAEIPQVVAIKIAPFNRYQTWDVVRAVMEAGRKDIALYTGNDDNIIADLLTPFTYSVQGREETRYITGGLLGQWGVWTRRAVELFEQIKLARKAETLGREWLSRNVALTDANAAVFDVANQFAGCIPGILEILRRQGLIPTNHCLNPHETLSPGQAEELDRVSRAYPWLVDDDYVSANRDRWLQE